MTVAQCVQQTAAPSLNVMKPVSDQMNKLVHCRCRSYGLLQAALRKSYTLQLGDLKVKKMVQDKSMAEANVNILLQLGMSSRSWICAGSAKTSSSTFIPA